MISRFFSSAARKPVATADRMSLPREYDRSRCDNHAYQGAGIPYTHYVVDGGKKRIILNLLVTPSEMMENQPMLDLLWRTQEIPPFPSFDGHSTARVAASAHTVSFYHRQRT